MSDEQNPKEPADEPPKQPKWLQLLEQIRPQLQATATTVSSDPFTVIVLRHLEQLATIVQMTVACNTAQIKPPISDEILRAAVVYAHASLEEAVRDVARRRIDIWPSKLLDEIPLTVRGHRKTKIEIHDLMAFGEKTVSQMVNEAACNWLDSMSFSSLAKTLSFLNQIGIDVRRIISENADIFGGTPDEWLSATSDLISRRHKIVRSQDYDPGARTRGAIDHSTTMRMVIGGWCVIAVVLVEEIRRHPQWKSALRSFCLLVAAALPASPETDVIRIPLTTIANSKGWPYLTEDDEKNPDQKSAAIGTG